MEERVDAYVLRADPPAESRLAFKEEVRVAYGRGDRWVEATAKLRIPHERWLVPGMTVPGVVDPARPDEIELLIDEVTPLEQRIAAADPPLCELERIAREVRHIAAQTAPLFETERAVQLQMLDVQHETLRQEHEAAAAARPQTSQTTPGGRLKGTADVVSFTRRPEFKGAAEMATTVWPGHRIVRVWLYGYPPYPVLESLKIKSQDPRSWLAAGNVPVTVATTDRTDVEYVWEGYDLSPERAGRELLERELGRAQSEIAAARSAFGGPIVEQAMAACHGVEQRRVLAQQLRAMGHDVPEHHLRDTERLAKLDALLARGVISRAEYDDQAARC